MKKLLISLVSIIVGLSICINANAGAIKNDSSVADLNNDVDVFTYKITEIKGNDIFGDAISDRTNDNYGIYISKSDLSFKPHKGDKIIVTFKKGIADEIKSIVKIK